MREDFRAWLEGEGYADNTCKGQTSQVQRLETAYGSLDALIENGGYDKLFAELSYTTDDERHNRPNPSKFAIDGNIRNNLASYKNSLARYRRFLISTPEGVADRMPTRDRESDPALAPDTPTLEKQRLSLERDMQTALRRDISRLEPGLIIIDDGAERAVLSGFIDILARDASGASVVIELKAGKTNDRVIGQVLGYMGNIADEDEPEAVRGIIVAHAFDQRTKPAARAVPDLRLVRYAVSFTFQAEV